MAVFIFVVVMPQDVATHTAHAVLSSAAFADFQEEVVRRQSMGDDMGAVRLWTSAVEIRHKPWGWLPMVRPRGLPPLPLRRPAWWFPIPLAGGLDEEAGFGGACNHTF